MDIIRHIRQQSNLDMSVIKMFEIGGATGIWETFYGEIYEGPKKTKLETEIEHNAQTENLQKGSITHVKLHNNR